MRSVLDHVQLRGLVVVVILASACTDGSVDDRAEGDELSEASAQVTTVLSDWSFMEWEPRLSTGIAGYQGVRLSAGAASIKNIGEIGRSSWYTPLTPILQWTIHDLSMTVSATGLSDGRVAVYLYDANGASLGVRMFFLEKGTYANKQETFSFITPTGTTHARVYVTNTGRGTVSFDAVALTRIDASTRTSKLVGNTRFLFTPRTNLADAALSSTLASQYQSRGYIHYRRSDPRFTYPNSIPQVSEVTAKLETFTTPGQHVGLWFTTYALQNINNVQLSLTGSLSRIGGGGSISQSNVALKMIRFWEQRSTWETTNYYVIPELLEELSTVTTPINIVSGTNQGFWVHIKVPPGTPAGTYTGQLTFNATGRPSSTIAIELEVLGFTLEKPSWINWVMYSDLTHKYSRGKHTGGAYSEVELDRYLAEMKEYGISGIVDSAYGRTNGTLSFDLATNIARLFKRSGMSGPLGLSASLQYMTAEAIGFAPSDWTWMTYHPGLATPEFESAYRQRLTQMDNIIRSAGVTNWYYYLTDEPAERAKLDLAKWEARNAKALPVPIKTMTSLYPFIQLTELVGDLDVDMNAFPAISQSDSSRYRNLVAANNSALWYLGAGSYSTQEGGLMPNRYNAGFLFYKVGATAHMSWTYQDYIGSPFDDLDGTGVEPKDACITYPAQTISTSRASIATLQWEGIREGIDDYKYLHTFKLWMQRARDTGQNAAADAAQAVFTQLMAGMPFVSEWSTGDSYQRPGTFTNADAELVRRRMADEILKLKAVVP
ncbi:MAG: glycoside hydrolase domain-containing protein [Kofleriaceae bacterium]